ncbi:hypothetical protein EH220_07165 [bacterium]|nr:MAG: hypothetical protein EH220_07165 [bacterium]
MRIPILVALSTLLMALSAISVGAVMRSCDHSARNNVILIDEKGRPLTVVEPQPGEPGARLIDADGNTVDAPSGWKSAE